MNFGQSYELDKTAKEGIWRTLRSGLKVKVASLRSPAYKTAILRLNKVYAAEMRTNDEAIINLITSKAMAETILLDWDGAEDLDGNPLEYSRDIAEEMLLKYEMFREEVAEVSIKDENYLVGEIVGKPKSRSTGKKSTEKMKTGSKG